MELYREIRAFAVKPPRQRQAPSPLPPDLLGGLRELAQGLSISSIETNEGEVVFHADMAFSLEGWDNAVSFLRSVLSFMKVKKGYLIVRKVLATPEALKTEIETYKVTKRGVYYTDLPYSAGLREDLMRLSGGNKRRQKADSIGDLFRPYGKDNAERTEE